MSGSSSSSTWPVHEYRVVPWTTPPDVRGSDGRRPNVNERMLTEITVELPPRIADVEVQLTSALASQCREVEDAIARLDARYGDVLTGLTAFLVRSESVASSRIEQVHADLDDIARASVAHEATQEARMTVAAAGAMDILVRGQEPGGEFSPEIALTAHHRLLQTDRRNHSHAGRYRDMQNWIGGSDVSPRNAVHVPPPPDEVEPLMADLAAFLNRDDVPPLAQTALAHAQFEAIHPFVDGNGRIGRGLIAVALRRRRVATQVVVPVAAAMLADVDRYFDTLTAYRRGDAAAMVSYLTRAAAHATTEAAVSAQRLSAMPQQWREQARPRAGSGAALLIDELTAHPVLDATAAQGLIDRSAPRTYEALERLTECGVLRETTGAARDRVWVAVDVMDEIEDLDERIGARSLPPKHWR